MKVIHSSIILFATSVILACSTTPAPVIDRAPSTKSSKSATSSSSKVGTDWRPNSYTVKKGDTLYSIGLEFGYDYKEIAQANHISAPYIIKIGQTLKFSNLNEATTTNVAPAPTQESENGVVTYAINNESPQASTTTVAPPATSINKIINEPKAIREPYSDEAYKKPLPLAKSTSSATASSNDALKNANEKALGKPLDKPQDKPADKVIAESTTDTKDTVEPKPEVKSKQDANGQLSWAWPTKGKVIANFNDAGNKGIDIAGKMGQAVHAAGSGKVIYSGSDLRGYGKLVIVKHNATFLSVYANNSLILVKEGQQVSMGQKIAEMGDTDSNTVKLHFEIRQQGKSIDPMKFLSTN